MNPKLSCPLAHNSTLTSQDTHVSGPVQLFVLAVTSMLPKFAHGSPAEIIETPDAKECGAEAEKR